MIRILFYVLLHGTMNSLEIVKNFITYINFIFIVLVFFQFSLLYTFFFFAYSLEIMPLNITLIHKCQKKTIFSG